MFYPDYGYHSTIRKRNRGKAVKDKNDHKHNRNGGNNDEEISKEYDAFHAARTENFSVMQG